MIELLKCREDAACGPRMPGRVQSVFVPLSSLVARPFRLSGFALVLALVALAVSPDGRPAAGAAGAAPQWLWPVGPPYVVSRPFVAPATTYAAGHRGIDIRVDAVTEPGPGAELGARGSREVIAPADGVVHFVGTVVDRPVLSLRHPGGLVSSFEPVDSGLVEGQPVSAGDVVGTVRVDAATPAHCPTPCLHFGVRLHGDYVSPLNFLGGIARSVLLPTRELR
ncbi:M23 family metallopeptidase [Marisediminicola antarctica]|nr:M23 family metallopeptidase [Marisediminicola antarctica]